MMADIRLAGIRPQMAKRLATRRPFAATKAIMVGLSGLLLAGADSRYANVAAQQPELTALSPEAEKANASTPGSEFRECARGCPVMVVIAAGRFIMGSPDHELDRRASEGPQHEVTIREPFAVSKFEVTFEEWDACVAASACSRAVDAWGRGEMPVINVSWDDARQYVDWLSRSTGKQYRLLTEAEWEYAARAGTTTPLSFGDYSYKRICDYAKFADASTRFAWKDDRCSSNVGHGAAPVGRHRPNPWGLHDMHGNVWEWVEDCWHASYNGAPTDGMPWLEANNGDCAHRITRGGSWRNAVQDLRVTARLRYPTSHTAQVRGFRVALFTDTQ
jgi:formylglycine-generating enzyme required for sulfatase activity